MAAPIKVLSTLLGILAVCMPSQGMVMDETDVSAPGGAAGVYTRVGMDSPFAYYQDHVVEACSAEAHTTSGWSEGPFVEHSASCTPPPSPSWTVHGEIWLEGNGEQGQQSDDVLLLSL